MYEQLDFAIEGRSALITHNGRCLTNPLHPLTKLMKRCTSKRNKTDEDILTIANLEWLGGLYLVDPFDVALDGNKVITRGGATPCIPGEVLESALIESAKKHKLGVQCRTGIICEGNFPLIYDGPKTVEEMWKSEKFWDFRKVRVQKNTIMRSRPIFDNWRLEFTVLFSSEILDADQVKNVVKTLGEVVGLCDYRPRHGRFVLAS